MSRPGNLQSPAARLQQSLEELMVSWQLTKDHWADENSRVFEETHLQRICDEISLALPAVAQLSQSMATAARECEE
ncbi:hypothetical protein [Planctomicrobium sp. SH664]|uniref:hypothetical protein n=1 Tax=Planctomicrobium sp. SH664 TaxID=3448125 RepID=UPI003F5B8D96